MKKHRLSFPYCNIRGAVGKQFVVKHYKNGPIMTKYPDMTTIIASNAQRKCRNLFKEAVAYAQTVIADPVKKAEWRKRIKIKNRVFVTVIKEYMLAAKQAIINRQLATNRLIRRSFITTGIKEDLKTIHSPVLPVNTIAVITPIIPCTTVLQPPPGG